MSNFADLLPLPPLDLINKPEPRADDRRYFRYYNINFADRFDGLQHLFGSVQSGTDLIACHVWLPRDAKGSVFILHGYLDHVGLFARTIEMCLNQGMAVFSFDLPGHGLSSGASAVIDEFEDYVQALESCINDAIGALPEPWYAIAQSTGCAVLMDYLLHTDEPAFRQATLLAPLVRPLHWPWIRLQLLLGARFISAVKRKFVSNSHDRDFLDFVRSQDGMQSRTISVRWLMALSRWIKRFERAAPSDFPLNVIQGDDDRTVDWRFNLPAIAKKFPAHRLLMLEGGRHHLANESDDYLRAIYDSIIHSWQQ